MKDSPRPRRPPAETDAYRALADHETYMRQLAARIWWLDRTRHWWLRTEDGRHQREFLEKRGAA